MALRREEFVMNKRIKQKEQNEIPVNRQYKDKIFCKLFGSEEYKENLLSLYNALNDTNYTNLDDLEINTLDDALYMNYKNDVSIICEAENMMSLYEHQSTFSPNMPLRGVEYFGQLYSKYLGKDKKRIYGTSLLSIPTPKYYVFYNGLREMGDVTTLKLSDMYDGKGDLECLATMININQGHSMELLKKCNALMEYSKFVDKVYHNIKKYDNIKVAIDKTVSECIKEGILEKFLTTHTLEVKGMLYDEYNQEEHMEVIREEGIEEGREEMVMELIKEGDIAIEKGAEKLGISVDEMQKLINA